MAAAEGRDVKNVPARALRVLDDIRVSDKHTNNKG